jgi:hypothetical protein
VLFLEWRWPIARQNTTWCGASGHTCDLHRQRQLLDHYTHGSGTLTIVWDTDQKLPIDDPLRHMGNVVICEAALHPTPGATSLLFPVADDALDDADASALAALHRDVPLAYVGDQCDRDDAFDTFFAPAAAAHRHLVAGKWTSTAAWPDVRFIGRIPFTEVTETYSRVVATVLLLPDRHAAAGQISPPLIDAVLAGCLPLTPTSIRDAGRFTPEPLHIADGASATTMVTRLKEITGTNEHVELITGCLRLLEVFRASSQLDVLERVLA